MTKDLKQALKEFQKKTKYGFCLMILVLESNDVCILWEHWKYTNSLEADRLYIGKFQTKLNKSQPIYLPNL